MISMNDDLNKYGSYEVALQMQNSKDEKLKQFIERMKGFENVRTLEEAKDLASKTITTNKELSQFYVGNAKCVVVNNDEMLRISIDSKDEFICYSFE